MYMLVVGTIGVTVAIVVAYLVYATAMFALSAISQTKKRKKQ